jgi:hypothetical protein
MFGLSFLTPTLLKWGGIAVAVLAVVLYIGTLRVERNHYKSSALEWESKYTAYRAAAESNANALKSSNAALTLQAKQSSIQVLQLQNDAKAKLLTRISNDQVSANIRVPASVLQLQHDTTTNPTDISKPAGALGGHAADTQPAGSSDGTVSDLLRADAINNAELNSCVDEVMKWNGFWNTFVNNVKAVESVQKN